MTNGRGDPNNATLFINLELFREAFVFSRMGYGAAIAWLLFAIVLVLTAACSRSPASASTTRAATDEGSAAARPANCADRDRSPIARSYRKFLVRRSITMFAVIIVGATCRRCCTW